MCVAEFALWAALGFLFWTKKLYRSFPAMGAYLVLRVASMPMLLFSFYGQTHQWFHESVYFFCYWSVYIVSAVLIFFICVEVFRSALSSFSGLMKLGTVAFRWVALASVIVSLSLLVIQHTPTDFIATIAYRLMRSVSILELCLLAFLCLSMNALRLSARSMAFGIALGFGLMSSSDFILASFVSSNTSLTGSLQFVSESVILLALGIWVTYCAVPEPARLPVMVPASSLVFRWNEIASALGHTGTQVAMLQPTDGILLTDVESVVENALIQNFKNSQAEI